jgi:hypothetical protein
MDGWMDGWMDGGWGWIDKKKRSVSKLQISKYIFDAEIYLELE